MLMKIKFYTFKDIVDYLDDNYPVTGVTYPLLPHQVTTSADWFSKALLEVGLKVQIAGIKTNSTIITSNAITGFIDELVNIIYNRHYKDFIMSEEVSYFDDYTLDMDDVLKESLYKIINVINLTAPKYIPLMYQYVENYEDPIKMLESVSESFNRFNDTPQNEIDNVDFNTGSYASTMGKTKNVSKVDSGSVIDRLEALKNKFRSVILDWSNEFTQLFLTDLQLEDY